MSELIANIFSLSTVLLNVLVVGLILLWLSSYFYQTSRKWLDKLIKLVDKKEILLAFILIFAATSGSLFYSEVVGYTPCELCWYQRIMMYPQVLLLGLALWKKDKNIADYSILLSVVGLLIAVYHYIVQFVETEIVPCSVVGYSISCSDSFVLDYGYITIPMMSLTIFVVVLILMLFLKINSNKSFFVRLLDKLK